MRVFAFAWYQSASVITVDSEEANGVVKIVGLFDERE